MSVPDEILRLFRLGAAPASRCPKQVCDHAEPYPDPLTERELLHALEHHQFVLHYQPQFDLQTGDILSVEALIRWDRPQHGLIPPARFLPLAAQCELIANIDDWALGAAARQAVAWDRAGLPPFGIALNVSAQQLHCCGFLDNLVRTLRNERLSPRRIEIEIREEAIMSDVDSALETLQGLHALGISLAIDDFGMGCSSLNALWRLPLDEIKIDRTFVKNMKKDERIAGMVRGMIELAHGLKMQVVAEGVETCEQIQRLLNLKCDRAQGNLLSRPMPGDELVRFVEEWPHRWHTMTH